MKITLNLFQPNFKAIKLNDEEKKQVSSTLHTLQTEDLPDFRRNILKSGIMDVFIPHIQEEAQTKKDPKSAKFDLNMKMFDALNSFEDKKDPIGWFLSVLNGTEYKDPEPDIFDLIDEQIKEKERLEEEEHKSKNNLYSYNTPKAHFDYDETEIYTKDEVSNRAKELRKVFGPEYRPKAILNIVEKNPYLVEYDNEYFENYVTEFAKSLDIDESTMKYYIASNPKLMRYTDSMIMDKAKEFANVSGCRLDHCKNMIVSKPQYMTRSVDIMNHNFDALNYYKLIRGKEPSRPEGIFSATIARSYFTQALTFLVSNTDKDILTKPIYNDKQLIKHIEEQGVKKYKFVIPKDRKAKDFVAFAEDFAMKNFGKNIFEFEIIDPNEYLRIKKPLSFYTYVRKKA